MRTSLTFAVASSSPAGLAREELASLYPHTGERWHQKMDRCLCLVTVRHEGRLIAAGIVHDSVLAPTESMDALELGCMAVHPAFRKLGIRERVTALRLERARALGGTPITVIDAANPASWAFYERSDAWERERVFEQDETTKFIYRALREPRRAPAPILVPSSSVAPKVDSQVLAVPAL
ncbi:GNAT family N-acetyltransferase [Glutamicibacter endophyticus]|uniref:GNAT family N-acetyltransferase n=1 Tax=Glutamicibacter endophyticus TaxID=1522174 RepID=UPI003AF0E0F6